MEGLRRYLSPKAKKAYSNYISASDAIKGYKESEAASMEDNDCVVRALAATTGVSYEESLEYCKTKLGRKFRRGVNTGKLLDTLREGTVFNKRFLELPGATFYKVEGIKVQRQMTVGTLLKKHNVGTYFVLIAHHAFAVKDGKVVGGNLQDAYRLRARIVRLYSVK